MSKWGNFNFDISSVGKVLKNVERSIDKVVGIPETQDIVEGASKEETQGSTMISTSPSSGFFGYSFTSPNQKSSTTPTTPSNTSKQSNQNTPKISNNSLVTSPISTPTKSPQLIVNNNNTNNSNNSSTDDVPVDVIPTTPSVPTLKVEEGRIFTLDKNKGSDSSQEDEDDEKPLFNIEQAEDLNNQSDDTVHKDNGDHVIKDIELVKTEDTHVDNVDDKTKEDNIDKPNNDNIDNNSNDGNNNNSLVIKELENKLISVTTLYKEKDKILGEREKQIENLTQQLSKVILNNEQLLKDIDRMNSDKKKEDIENLKEEFSRRIGQLEKKLQTITKERDALKSGSSVSENTITLMKEKDEKLQQLLEEGTALSHKILALESTVKKQRSQLKEQEEKIQLFSDRIETTDNLLAQKSDKLKELEESDRKYQDTINTMREVSEIATKKFDERDKDAGRATKQLADLQNALDKAWKDQNEQTKQHQLEIDKLQRQLADSKLKYQDDLQMELNLLKKEYSQREDHWESQLQDQRSMINQNAEKWKWKEEELNREIINLQQRCRDAENRNDQISSSIPDATRPLLKQIESLESSLEQRQSAFDAIEKSLLNQIKEERGKYDKATGSQQDLQLEIDELLQRLKQSELQLKKANKQIQSAQTEIQNEKVKVQQAISTHQSLEQQNLTVQSNLTKADLKIQLLEEKIEKSQKEIKEMREQEEKRIQTEKLKNVLKNPLSYSTNDFNNSNSNLSNFIHEPPSPSSASPLSTSSSGLNNNYTPTKIPYSGFKRIPSQHDLMQQNQSFSHEYFQTSFHQKDSEISMLQSQNQSLENSRKKLEDELVKLTTQNESLLTECKELKSLRQESTDLKQRLSTALEILGEREESVNELKLDIVDMKELYKTQINELLLQIENLKSK
ncbi:TMF1-like protein [Tieghemostelium lacteum]|uniref:TMF1-like protein n=1 Tax=Tieghemostelium lacteum TaxID=361077 RepID=A0A151Z7I2_TIELA|nr:TMF1-like protein [Tieghemostelium lacteum]|eukprot:KYQ89744.1 TMF1-like protein [Tieghemostelium lacteum]